MRRILITATFLGALSLLGSVAVSVPAVAQGESYHPQGDQPSPGVPIPRYVPKRAQQPQAPRPGQMPCGRRANVVGTLSKQYGESVRGLGLSGNGHMVEMFTSPRGDWTLTATTPSGLTCILASGSDWHSVPATEPETGS